jgi:hypothetical protein
VLDLLVSLGSPFLTAPLSLRARVCGYSPRHIPEKNRGALLAKYRLKVPISAILDRSGGQKVYVTLPTGAVLYESSQPSSTLFGMLGVLWEGRHYSVYLKDLLKKAERVSTA